METNDYFTIGEAANHMHITSQRVRQLIGEKEYKVTEKWGRQLIKRADMHIFKNRKTKAGPRGNQSE